MYIKQMNIYRIHDKIYDLTDFISKHPGGTDMFTPREGILDITPLIYSYHKDPNILFEILPKYEIVSDNAIVKYGTDYKYDKYLELKKLVYDEIHDKQLPLYWSNRETAYNIGMFILYVRIWIYCSSLETVNVLWFVLLAIFNIGHCALIFHETSHYTGFKNQRLNTIVSNIAVAPILTNAEWKWDHNYLHHCFTNTELDNDFAGHSQLFRHSSDHQHLWQHQLQHIYASMLFCLGGFSGQIDSIKHERWNFMLFLMILYWFGMTNTFVFYGLTGFLFLSIAQLSHIQQECVTKEKTDDFLTNQVSSSMNFKTDNPVIRFICFGLDIQIEHHLFPNIPHSTLRLIQPIVREYCDKNGVAYIEKPDVISMAKSYLHHLREMGKRPNVNI